jgi:hypothetical protein
MNAEVREAIHGRLTLSRYLKALVREGVIARNHVSHKNVVYEIAPGEQSSWLLAAHEMNSSRYDATLFATILDEVHDKAKALDIALNYAFRRFLDEEIKHAPAKVIGGMPRYRTVLVRGPRGKGLDEKAEDWSDDMIAWHSRQYRMFLKNLRKHLLKYPQHLGTYLRERPWLQWPVDDQKHDLELVRQILADKYPDIPNRLALMAALRQAASARHNEDGRDAEDEGN